MILSIATTYQPATDLGYLLAKNPARCHAKDTTFGSVTLFFSEAGESRAVANIVLSVDPVRLVRGAGATEDQYVNDAPYALSSLMSVGLREILSTALSGRSKERQELAETPIPLEIELPVLPIRGRFRENRQTLLADLFTPLGWEVTSEPIPLDSQFPEWGASAYVRARLKGVLKLQDALRQLYVLLPVLDDAKHYWIDRAEVEKLMRAAGEWLPNHPLKALITRRYLRKPDFVRDALARLIAEETEKAPEAEVEETAEDPAVVDSDAPADAEENQPAEKSGHLHKLRLQTVAERIASLGAKSVLDLGCGEGKLLRLLAADPRISRIVGLDVSYVLVTRLESRLNRSFAHISKKASVIHGSLTYRDSRLLGFDAAALVEVIEHLDLGRLDSLENNVFGYAKPTSVLVTTPNRDYNVKYGLEGFRHDDHRFEWTRAQFNDWCARVSEKFGYLFEIEPLGPVDEALGAPSQMAVFRR